MSFYFLVLFKKFVAHSDFPVVIWISGECEKNKILGYHVFYLSHKPIRVLIYYCLISWNLTFSDADF